MTLGRQGRTRLGSCPARHTQGRVGSAHPTSPRTSTPDPPPRNWSPQVRSGRTCKGRSLENTDAVTPEGHRRNTEPQTRRHPLQPLKTHRNPKGRPPPDHPLQEHTPASKLSPSHPAERETQPRGRTPRLRREPNPGLDPRMRGSQPVRHPPHRLSPPGAPHSQPLSHIQKVSGTRRTPAHAQTPTWGHRPGVWGSRQHHHRHTGCATG